MEKGFEGKEWNLLPEEVVKSDTIIIFKRDLDGHLNRQAIEDTKSWSNSGGQATFLERRNG